jgi:hypothetical protein
MILLNSVLVAFDFSETSTHALTYGHNLARAFGGRLHVRRAVLPRRARRSRGQGERARDGSGA